MLIITDQQTAADIQRVADELAARPPEVRYDLVQQDFCRLVTTYHLGYNGEGGIEVQSMTKLTALGEGPVFFAQ